MYATSSDDTTSASEPSVPLVRAQRGSVARSAIGCRATRMPAARYSCRAMSAKRRTRSGSLVAPSPIGSGQAEKPPAAAEAAGLSITPWRGSVETVTGMPSRVPAAISWTRLCHSAILRGVTGPKVRMLKWFSRPSRISDSVDGIIASPGGRVPSGLTPAIVWNISPAFSARVIRPSRSVTRSSVGSSGFW